MSGSKPTDKRDTLERIRVTAGKLKELSQKRASIHRKIKGGRINKGERGRGCVCTREQNTEQNAHHGSRRERERGRDLCSPARCLSFPLPLLSSVCERAQLLVVPGLVLSRSSSSHVTARQPSQGMHFLSSLRAKLTLPFCQRNTRKNSGWRMLKLSGSFGLSWIDMSVGVFLCFLCLQFVCHIPRIVVPLVMSLLFCC